MDITQSLPTADAILQLEPEELGGYLMETLSNPKAVRPRIFILEILPHESGAITRTSA